MSEKEQEGNDLSIYWKPAFGQRIHEIYGRSLEDLESPQFHTFVKPYCLRFTKSLQLRNKRRLFQYHYHLQKNFIKMLMVEVDRDLRL